MKKVYITFLCLCFASWNGADTSAGAGSQVAQADISDEEIALTFIRNTGVNQNFPLLIREVLLPSVAIRGLKTKYGLDSVEKVISEEIQKSINDFGPEWDKNLALSYLEFFSSAELSSLATELNNSPFVQKFMRSQNAVGNAMQERSNEILRQASHQTLSAILGRFTSTN